MYNNKSKKTLQKNLAQFNTFFLAPGGQPVYTANLTVGASTMVVEIPTLSNSQSTFEFKQDPEGVNNILTLFECKNIKGVRLMGKKGYCHQLAETFLKRGIRPLIAFSKKSKNIEVKGMPVLQEYVAGIDIGKSVIYVAVPPCLDEEHTRVFGTFSDDLEAIVAWLKELKIQEIAMESTSVYWIPLYELCEHNGIKPILVNPKYVKTLPGRKTDVLDSQWLMRLLACGMLQAGFIPPQPIRDMRDLTRHRQDLMGRAGDCLNIVHKTILSGIEESCAATIIFETGGNMDAFPTSKHFASWNGTAPGNKVSGGKMLSGKAPKKFSRVGQALRIAANANHKADSASGGYLRRLVRNGKSKKAARKATAHRLGTQVYNIMKFGQSYVEKGAADYEKAFEEKKIIGMTKALNALGYNVTKIMAE